MKKKLVIYLAGALTVMAASFGSAQFSDVPAGHWAKGAVDVITSCGLIAGFPDGTYRGNQNLTRYQAALIFQRLLAEMKAGNECVTGAMSDEDMSAGVKELAAELAELGTRVSALEDNAATQDDIAALQEAIDELQSTVLDLSDGVDGAALADLEDQVAGAVAANEELGARVDGLEESVSDLTEIVSDLTGLEDRIAALEEANGTIVPAPGVDVTGFATGASVAALSSKVDALSGDVSVLKRNAFTISGDLSLEYLVKRGWKPGVNLSDSVAVDIDRIFSTSFGSTTNGNVTANAADLGGADVEGDTTAKLNVNITTGLLDGTSDSGGYNKYPKFVGVTLKGGWTGTYTANNVETDDTTPANFEIDAIKTTLDIAAGQTLWFQFGVKTWPKFTEYVFDNDYDGRGAGFIANYSNGGVSLQGVYGSTGGANTDDLYYRGLRATSNLGGIKLGGSFVQEGPDQSNTGGAVTVPVSVWGVDASGKVGPLSVSGEYFSTNAVTTDNTGLYVVADGSFGAFKLGASYRNIGNNITGANTLSNDVENDFDKESSDNSASFRNGQNGFGITGETSLGILGLSGYFQSYNLIDATGSTATSGDVSAFGVTLKAAVGPLALEGWYKNATLGGVQQTVADEKVKDGTYGNEWGVKASSTGTIIPGLNLTAKYVQPLPTGTADIQVYGDYTLNSGPITAQIGGRWHNNTTTKYGINVETTPLFAGFSVFASGAHRDTTPGNVSEGLGRVGIRGKNFLFSNSSLQVWYGGYAGTNIADLLVSSTQNLSDINKVFDYSEDKLYSGAGANGGQIKGLYTQWTYWDLAFSYADFDIYNNSVNVTDHAMAFKIAYKVTF